MERVNSVLCLFLKPRGQLGMTEAPGLIPKGQEILEQVLQGSLTAPKSSKLSTAAEFLALSPHLSHMVCNRDLLTLEKQPFKSPGIKPDNGMEQLDHIPLILGTSPSSASPITSAVTKVNQTVTKTISASPGFGFFFYPHLCGFKLSQVMKGGGIQKFSCKL